MTFIYGNGTQLFCLNADMICAPIKHSSIAFEFRMEFILYPLVNNVLLLYLSIK